MGIRDNDLLDQALDSAEARIEESNTPEEISTPEATTPELSGEAEDAIVAREVETSTKTPQKSTKSRDSTGKFLPKEGKAAKTAAPTEKPDLNDQDSDSGAQEPLVAAEGVETPGAETAPIEYPEFWSAKMKEAIAKAPMEAQRAFMDYDAQRTQWAYRLENDANKGKHLDRRSKEVFEPHRARLQAAGIKDPFEASERLLAWDELFQKNPRLAIADLMRKNGIHPNELLSEDLEQSLEANPQENEQITAIRQQNEQLQAQIQAIQDEGLKTQVESFKEGKDSYGNLRRPFAEAYAPQILKAVDTIQAQRPETSLQEALDLGYEYVLKEVRKLHGVSSAKPQVTPEDAARRAARVAAAASSVSGAPSSGTASPRPPVKNIDEALDRAEARLGIR